MMGVFVNLLVTARQCFKSDKYAMPTVLKDEELQSIRVPALFLVGENDGSCSVQKAVQRLNKVAPQIRAEVIPDVGHSFTIVQADGESKDTGVSRTIVMLKERVHLARSSS
jgi:pimeloyl-ACP methyl ester carboxylesterase